MSFYGNLYAIPPVLDPTMEIADPPKKRAPDNDEWNIEDYSQDENDSWTEDDEELRRIVHKEIKIIGKRKKTSNIQRHKKGS